MLALIAKLTAYPALALIFRPRRHGKKPRIKGPAIIMYNHISRVDAIIISHLFSARRLWFMAKKTIFRTRWRVFASRLVGMYPASGTQSSVDLLRRGKTIAITPEGTRSPGGVGPFRTGIVVIAMQSGAPIIPVRIHSTFSFRRPTDITFGDPIYLSEPEGGLTREALESAAEELRSFFCSSDR